MIDLQQFCSKPDQCRPYLERPFSHGAWTYATDGRICVRVPRRDEVPASVHPRTPSESAERIFTTHVAEQMWSLATIKVPPAKSIGCDCFDGHEHPCPDCTCECEACGGTGKVEANDSVSLGQVIVPGRYLRLIQMLPNAEIGPDDAEPSKAVPFRFDGGEGIVVAMTDPNRTHTVVELPARLSPTPHAEAAP